MKGLIATVGHFTKPLVKSIEEYKPDLVCFYFPNYSGKKLKEIRRELKHEEFDIKEFPVDNPQDFNNCFGKASEATKELRRKNIYPNDTLLDYTGGTKVMASALVAATLGKGFRYALVAATFNEGFQYIYMGKQGENEGGLGYIEGGMGEILSSKNPWEIHALEAKRKIKRNFNNYRFKSVIDQTNSLKKRGLNSDRDKYLLDAVQKLAKGYSCWDRFHYENVKEKLQNGARDLETYKDLAQPESYLDLSAQQVKENIEFLNDLQRETFGFDFEKRIGTSLAIDMFWNATRRYEEGKYDDAMVRLYRTVEMIGQVEIHNELGHHTDSIPAKSIPEELRNELLKKSNKEDKIELGLNDNFHVLSKLGNDVGKNFLKHKDEFKKIMRTRNTSFLTHNFKAIEEHQFTSLKEKVKDIFDIQRKVEFPKLKMT